MRKWVFTINNPTVEFIDLENVPSDVRYMVYQKEAGASGTVHFQGYVELRKPQRMSWMKKWLGEGHFEHMRSNRNAARAYCMKEESRIAGPFEYGTWIGGDAVRTSASVKDAMEGKSLEEIMVDDPESYCRHKGVLKKARSLFYKRKFCEKYSVLDLNRWQTSIMDIVNGEPNDREVIWCSGNRGGEGKTTFGQYLVAKHGAFMFNGGRNEDITFAYDYERIVVMDIARCQDVRYDLIEHFKDGVLFNQKYESHVMYFCPIHLIVLTNVLPDYSKISPDRIVLFEL